MYYTLHMTISELVTAVKATAINPIGTHEENLAWLEWVLKVLTEERDLRTRNLPDPTRGLGAPWPSPCTLEDLALWKADGELASLGESTRTHPRLLTTPLPVITLPA